jgi:MFS family permease
LAIGFVPMIMIVMNLVYAASAYPAGIASDHLSRRMMLVAGLSMLVVAEVALAVAAVPWQVFAGAGLWGLHMGFTQGLFNKLVADSAPEELRGTAFGIFNLTTGISMLVASVVAGSLWQVVGPQATFFAGANFAAVALIGVLTYRTHTAVA